MRIRLTDPRVLTTMALLCGGCQSYWYETEPVADMLIPPTNPWSMESSRKDLAETVGKPCDLPVFADQAVYMGDKDGYRYVHVRSLFGVWQFFGGDCDYRIPESQWPMKHPMPLTTDATLWQHLAWMNGDAPCGIPQSAFLKIEPSYPLGVPATQPTTMPSMNPATSQSSTNPTPSR